MLNKIVNFKTIGLIMLLIAFVLILKSCFQPVPPAEFDEPLDVNTHTQIIVQPSRQIAVRTHKESVTSYVPDDGDAVINVTKEGLIELDVKTAGWTFRPVAGPMLTTRLRLAAGAQVAYWNRFEVYVGGAGPEYVAFGGVGYRLDQVQLLSNTSIYVGYTSRKEIGIGVLWRF